MALKDGIDAGGVYASVGLDFDQLDKDLADLDRKLEAAGRSARVKASVDVSASGGGGGGGGGGNGALIGVGVAIGSILSTMSRATLQIAAGMSAVSGQVKSAAASLKTVADATKATQKAAHDLYREEARQYHAAQATRLFARTAGGQREIERGTGFARLPADIRYIASAGFNSGGIRAVRPGAGAGAATAATSPGVAGPQLAAGTAPAPGNRYRQNRAGTSMAGAVPLTVLKALYETARRTETALAAIGHTGVLAFTLVSGAVRGVELRLQRFGGLIAPIGKLLGGAFTVAMLPIRAASGLMGLFGKRAEDSGKSLSLLGKLAAPLAAPIRAAHVAAEGLRVTIRRIFAVAGFAAIAAAVAVIAKGFKAAADADKTTTGLMARFGTNVNDSAKAVGGALQPAFQEILALVIEIQEATKGVTPFFVSIVSGIGGAIKGVVHFIRQMIASWGAAKEFVAVTFQQFGENAAYMAGYIADVFGRFLDWFSNNWRTIFMDAFTVVADGIKNLATNIWDFIKAIFEWLKDPVNNTFEFKATPIIDTSKLQTDAMVLPEFKIPDSYREKLADLAAKIAGTEVVDPKKLATGKKGGGESKVGELVGSKELHSMLQRGLDDAKKKDSKNLEKMAGQGEKVIGKLGEIAKGIGKGILGMAGP